jgi:hypothetical protein
MIQKSWMHLSAIACFMGLSTLGLNPTSVSAQNTSNTIPAALQVPSGQTFLSKVKAEGDQIYICTANVANQNQLEWVLKAPEAKLLKEGIQIGKHYGGPTWEGNDGSKIVGQVKAKVTAPQPDAIPWLLLEVKTRQGSGSMTQVNWIQRVQTSGGKAPTTGCDRAHENATVRVGYSADYLFYGDADKHAASQRESYGD